MGHLMVSVGARCRLPTLEAVDAERVETEALRTEAVVWMLPAGEVVERTDVEVRACVILLTCV